MDDRELMIQCDGMQVHAKLDFPTEKKEKYPLMILQHGYTGHMEERHIRGIAQAATEVGYACLRVELYGHGKSEGAFRDHTIFKWMDQIMAVIDYAETLDFVEYIVLAGHSQGGLNVMLAAGLKGDRLKGLMPLAPAIVIPDNCRAGNHFGQTFDPEHVPAELPVGDGRVLGGNYFRTFAMIEPDDYIRKYKGPVMIIHADTDEAVTVTCAYDAAKKYQDCRLRIIKDDTHCYDRKLPEVQDCVKEFLLEMKK